MQGLQEMVKRGSPSAAKGGSEEDHLDKEENLDVEIAEGVGLSMMNTPEAKQVLQAAVDGSGDPAAKFGTFFAQMIDKIQTKLQNTDIPLSPRVWLSQGGVLDRWMDDLSEDGLVQEEMKPLIKEEVVNVLKLQQKSVNKGQSQQPPQEQSQMAPPPMPDGMMGGMPL